LSTISAQQLRNQIYYNEMAFRNILGFFPQYLRPPFSSCNAACEQFLEQAEKEGRRWFSFGFDEWLRAGQWWLMSSQEGLYSSEDGTSKIEPQPYADLLKSASILLDILPRHPSIRLWDPTKEYLQFQLLAHTLKRELETIERLGLEKPELSTFDNLDLSIWTTRVEIVSLQPGSSTAGPIWWEAETEETLFQGFGTFKHDVRVTSEPCMILVLVSKVCIEEARVVVQNQRGAALSSVRISSDLLYGKPLPGEVDVDNLNTWPYLRLETSNCLRPLANCLSTIRIGDIELGFSTLSYLREFSAVLRGLVLCQRVCGVEKDHLYLHTMIVIFTFM